jgi:RNA polymerase sigma factor (sigma-70 family)
MHNSPALGNISVMTPRLRTLIDQVARSAEPDAVLVRRFADTRDPQAFAELVRRYGRLVWGQCRHLLNSETDADDAFQATFLTLAKSVRTLRDTNKLGPWLHGVAYRVCLNSRRLAARRTKRERTSAKSEATKPVADSAWDQAFAAVHDELAKLPDTLRVPFVLCVLEGKGTTEAAEQLGLKLGTFSSRLSRAKQTLFDRLSARGLTTGLATIGAVAVGASTAPAAVAIKACDLAAGGPVSANILSLSSGVLNMAMMNAKRWVVAAVLGCGLVGIGGAGVWTANAQEKKPDPKPTAAAEDQRKQLEALLQAKAFDAARAEENLKKAQADAAAAADALRKLSKDEGSLLKNERLQKEKAAGPEFLYFGQENGYAPTAAELERTIKQVEADGYTFVGVVTMKGLTKAKDNEAVPTLVFRRTAAPAVTAVREDHRSFANKLAEKVKEADHERELRDQIDKLNRQLAELKAKPRDEAKAGNEAVEFQTGKMGFTAETGSQFVTSLIRLKFGEKAAGGLSFDPQKDALIVKGLTKEQAVWLSDAVNGLSGSKSPK